MTMKISVSGLRELDRALGELPKAAAKTVLRRTLEKAGQPIADEAQRLAPVDTGKLAKRIVVSPRIKNKVGKAEFAAAMRAGLGTKAAVAALRQARREAKGQGSFAEMFVGPARGVLRYAHLVEFGTVKIPPKPYMRPAWDARKGEALDIIRRELGNEIIMAARRIARNKKAGTLVKYRASLAALMAVEAG
jgi:HK97 gp10 family phage protein